MAKVTSQYARKMRHERLRKKVDGTTERPRLCVFRSLEHIYAQVIDDTRGATLAQASTLDAEFKEKTAAAKMNQAEQVGKVIARRAQEAGIKEVVFDRGGYKYHGRVKALADGARAAGLSF
ncbi:50S ribosomal protein L18 [Dehalogenimonas sp. THU2]|jgi:large subunit ribosomal protein L18|uniref:50S ribosomal protein L18 n=1 Tax=Dehalogenimonas sp. THU2 TaxID=3151121 RepID=UPI0032183CD4